jgi:hypothetical protein
MERTGDGRGRTLSLIWSNSYGEFMTMFSKTVAERTRPGQRQDVEEQSKLAVLHMRAHSDELQTTRSTPMRAQKASVALSSPITTILAL